MTLTSRTRLLGMVALAAMSAMSASVARADEAADRAARWKELSHAIFADRPVTRDNLVTLDAPAQALDAAIVPVTLSNAGAAPIKGEWLVIDENPSPLAAHFTFGPAGDPDRLSLRVRVDTFTNVHAVAETADGKLHETQRFVKAAGGCSAPVGMSDDQGLGSVGFMRLKRRGNPAPGQAALGQAVPLTLMIWHPNYNGMQMNPVTQTYTPARYIRALDVTYNDKLVFHMDGDISISSNPVIEFAVLAAGKGALKVVATDSQQGRYEHSFDLSVETN